MSTISIDEAVAGMVLNADARQGGRVLLNRGAELTPGVIERMKNMGVRELDVIPPEAAGGGFSEEDLLRAEEHVRHFFVYVDPDDPAMLEMYRMAVIRSANAVGSGWVPPAVDERLTSNLEHLKDLYYSGEFTAQDLVDHEMELESFPDIYFRIKKVLETPKSSARDIAEVVSTDVNISAKLLRLVNSPFYGFASKIDSITRAIAIVGARELTTLALGLSAITFFKDIPPELADMRLFWKHSVSVGILAKLLSPHVRGASPERAFTAGLLHDVGRLVIFKKEPYASVQTLLFARENCLPIAEAELDVIGFSHADVGGALLASWQFPGSLTDIVQHHHTPTSAANPAEAALVQTADNLANALEISEGGLYVVPGMEEGAWASMDISPSLLEKVVQDYEREVNEIAGIFLN